MEYGFATFTNIGTTVELAIAILDCQVGKTYQMHIHAGASCDDAMTQGLNWDPPRGDGIPELVCNSGNYGGVASLLYRRDLTDPHAWTVNDGAGTDVTRRVAILYSPDDSMTRIACGIIEQQ